MVTSPLGRLVTSKHTTKGHLATTKSPPVDSPLRVISYCFVFFSHVQTTNLKLKLSRPNGIACLRKQKLPRRRAMYKCRSLGSGTVHLRTQRWRAEISLLLNSSQWVKREPVAYGTCVSVCVTVYPRGHVLGRYSSD